MKIRELFCPFLRFVLIAVAVCSVAAASEPAFGDEATAYVAVERFQWKEFDGFGAQLVKETGPLFRVGFSYASEFEGGLTLRPAAELFLGIVDYDGHACDPDTGLCIPATSDVTYYGLDLSGDAGWRFGSRELTAEPFAGIGLRTWLRDIDNGTAADGTPTSGYPEYWFTLNARLGVRASTQVSEGKELSASAGIKLPLYNQTTAYVSDIGYSNDTTVEPGKKASFFAEAGFRAHELSVTLFYDSLRFSESDQDTAVNLRNLGTYIFWQPKSEMDTLGLRLGYTF